VIRRGKYEFGIKEKNQDLYLPILDFQRVRVVTILMLVGLGRNRKRMIDNGTVPADHRVEEVKSTNQVDAEWQVTN
jgi:hypothetical protein